MQKSEFKSLGYQIIDWIADYMENGYEGPVNPSTQPGEVFAQIPQNPPKNAETAEAVMHDFNQFILPHTLHWNDPRFFAYFPCNHSGAAILGDLLASGLGVNTMSWATGPAGTELEQAMLQWLGHMIGLDWPGVIQDTASTGVLCALLAAREQKEAINQKGFYGQRPLVVYTSEHAHSSVQKAARIAGIGDHFLRLIPGDANFAMDSDALKNQMESDVEDGLLPLFVCGTVGTTSTTAVDPISEIAEICQTHQVWLHVDAALAGTAAILPEMKWLMDGVDRADSFLFNPHKWMVTSFDCCAFFIKDPMLLKRALSIQPEYLKTAADNQVENYRDWNIQLGRRFRALKIWFVLRLYGVEKLQNMIRLHLEMAKTFADWVSEHDDLYLVGEPKIQTVCFAWENNDKTAQLMAAINDTGEAFLSHTVVGGRYVIRVSFGQVHSGHQHREALQNLINRCLDSLR